MAFCVLKNRNMDLVIILHNDTLVVDSLTVADVFNKEHKRVLRDIRKRIDELENLPWRLVWQPLKRLSTTTLLRIS